MKSEIKLPTSWEAVNLKQFAALQNKLQQEDTDVIEQYIDIISILSNEKPSLIMKMPIDSLKKAIEYLNFINELPKETKIKNQIEINGVIYKGTLDITKLTAGQYIDIKTFCKDTDSIFENLANIMAVIYVEENEEYDGAKHAQRARLFQEKLNINDVYGFALFFFETIKRFDNGYSRLYTSATTGDSGVHRSENYNEQWGWFNILDMLAKGDVLKFDDLLKKNIVWFLNMVAYFKDKAEEERKQIEHAKRQNRF